MPYVSSNSNIVKSTWNEINSWGQIGWTVIGKTKGNQFLEPITYIPYFKNAGFATLRCKMLLICFSKESGASARIRRGDSATSISPWVQSRGGDAGWTVLLQNKWQSLPWSHLLYQRKALATSVQNLKELSSGTVCVPGCIWRQNLGELPPYSTNATICQSILGPVTPNSFCKDQGSTGYKFIMNFSARTWEPILSQSHKQMNHSFPRYSLDLIKTNIHPDNH